MEAALESFTIVTTAASPALADIHHRQPAIIDSDRFDDWLDPTSPVPRLLDLVREPWDGSYERRGQHQGEQGPERRPGYSDPDAGEGLF